MPISKKILDEIKNATATAPEKKLMLEILAIEDSGTFRFEAAYEKAIKDYIDVYEQEGADT